jgi:hypothetical protein
MIILSQSVAAKTELCCMLSPRQQVATGAHTSHELSFLMCDLLHIRASIARHIFTEKLSDLARLRAAMVTHVS